MKVGDKVTTGMVLRTENPVGNIIKITNEYTVIKWDGVNGHWHYTSEQMNKIKKVE